MCRKCAKNIEDNACSWWFYHACSQCCTMFPNFLNLLHAKLLFTFTPLRSTCLIFELVERQVSIASKHFSVSGLPLKSTHSTLVDFFSSSNSLYAPQSLISQLASLTSTTYSQKQTAAATHSAPWDLMGESDISMRLPLSSMIPCKQSLISFTRCSSSGSSTSGTGVVLDWRTSGTFGFERPTPGAFSKTGDSESKSFGSPISAASELLVIG